MQNLRRNMRIVNQTKFNAKFKGMDLAIPIFSPFPPLPRIK